MRIVKDAEERKKEILDVAEKLFAEKGFDYTSTNDILNEIGIARGTLYYHFKSKEDILDAVIDRITNQLIDNANAIAKDKSIPILQRLTRTIMSLNVESDIGYEVMKQVHRPQNALMHQKMQKRLLLDVDEIVTKLIEECISEGICETDYPKEVVEMVMLYSNTVFDDMIEYTKEEKEKKILAFIYNIERMLNMENGSLKSVILPIFKN